MCGIAGYLSGSNRRHDDEVILRMTSSLAHRGPDAFGVWRDKRRIVALGHRRLAILDLTSNGAQPMVSKDGRFTITYNGEIYNFKELRSQLEAADVKFIGTSDTEVLVEAIATWGVERTLVRLNGMFAFGVWDDKDQCLWLARDRFGEKPLYYGIHGGDFMFGSELKALAGHPSFSRNINLKALPLYLRFNYVPSPHCIFADTWKLAPAHLVRVRPGHLPEEPRRYWSLNDLVGESVERRTGLSDFEVVDALEHHLRNAVKLRMVADVPLGAFLSGGIDSSLIVAIMQELSSRAIKTFTIGFWESPYNEAKDAARVARHLGTEHHELYVSAQECMGVVSRIADIYDEPFADSSQIPTTIVSEFTRKHVTVALSGDAGDELFGGYNRYFWSARLWPKLARVPCRMRGDLARILCAPSPASWDRFFRYANYAAPPKLRVRGGGEKIHKFAAAMSAGSPDDLYFSYVSQWQRPSMALLQGGDSHGLNVLADEIPRSLHFVERMMYMDMLTYLPSDILCKVDRASMSVGLEARVPFLDNDLVDFAWRLPLRDKIRSGVGKWPLRALLRKYVPESSFERPKAGFGIPIGDWLRGPMRDWAESQLSKQRLDDDGIFRSSTVRQQWADHLSGRRNLQHSLWSILMFQAWKGKWT